VSSPAENPLREGSAISGIRGVSLLGLILFYVDLKVTILFDAGIGLVFCFLVVLISECER